MGKKKFHGGLKLLLSLLFIMLLGLSSTSYALTPSNEMTEDIAKAICDYINVNQPFKYTYYNGAGNQSDFNSYYQTADYNDFVIKWNNSGIENYCDYLEQCVFICQTNSSKNRL